MAGGLGMVLAGGAAGWGKGKMEEIKAVREEKLRQLELDRADARENKRLEFEKSENEMTRGLQREQIAATKEQTAAELASRERIAGNQNTSQERIADKGNTADMNRTQAQIDANKELQEQANEARQNENMSLGTYKTEDGKTVQRYTRPDGKVVPNPIDENGKELTPVIDSSKDTNEIINNKWLVANGVDPKVAQRMAFNEKSTDPDKFEADFVADVVKGRASAGMGTDEAQMKEIVETAKQGRRLIFGEGEAAASSEADDAAVVKPRPEGVPDDQLIEDAKKSLAKTGADKAAIKARLRGWGIDPAKAGL